MSDRLPLPLAGVRVLDRTVEVGELCGRLLADLGAEVVKVEPPGGSRARSMPPRGLWWPYRNWNERSVTDDAALVAGADVVLSSEAIEPAHAGQIACAITWFGLTGPDAGRPATDDVIVAMSGWLSQSGVPEKPPLLVPGTVASDTASAMGAWAVLVARWRGGAHAIDVSALEAVVQIDNWSLVNASTAAPRRVRGGPQLYPAMPTLDGAVKVVVMSLQQWRAVQEWLGHPEALADPALDQMMARILRREEIFAVLAPFLAGMTTSEAAEEAQRRGIVVTPVNGPAELLVDDHLLARGALVDVEVADGITGRVPAGFWELDGERIGYRFRAPSVGEHDGAIEWPARPAGPPTRQGAPLAGLRVLDFGHGGVGVQAGRLFADHGADVIKIESARHPDFMRLMGANGTSPSFASSSRSKRSLGVDLKSTEGADLVRRLAATADVVIENNSAGTMDGLGLGWADLRAINPRLVMLSSQLLGSSGPRAGWSGYGPSVQAYGGLVGLWAFDDGEGAPGSPSNHPDLLVGHLLGVLGMAALIRREATGEGGHGELAQAEAVACTLGELVLAESIEPGSVGPDGNRDERGAPWGVFRSAGAEEWVVVCAGDTHAAAAASVAGDDLAEWCADRGADNAAGILAAAGVPAGRMLYPDQLPAERQLVARGFLAPLDQPDIGPLVVDRQSYRCDTLPLPPSFPAPRLGEHTREVCAELGLAPADVDRFLASGVLEE